MIPPHRSFSSSHARFASLSSHPPGHDTELVYAPTPEALQSLESEDSDGPDIDLIPPEEAKLQLTERAAEQLRAIAQRQNNDGAGLRIGVESGGCHGYQYKLELATERKPDDYQFSHPTIKPSNILIDAVSMSLMKGSVIDFATELIGSSFRVAENPQAKGSGCGCGVSWELKI
ncbi:iron-sulfur cluster assembly accessory protein [Phanerochaete sordida]|uniref:Iron-sulfur cluster assembly accessory protein n=1 Tax=Phanerochaete sordida TaxID=48140 RepID=A0A9P3LJ90_9APHY|nr:iron-sulfur cluster assembly accessory protein [Phanerochaete sordida]